MFTIETLSIVFTGLSISLAAFYYINTLRNAQKAQELQIETRQAQLFMQLWDRYNTVENNKNINMVQSLEWTDFEDYHNNIRSNEDPDFRARIDKTFGMFEGLGVLVEEGFIDPGILAKYVSGNVIDLWERFGPIIVEYRRRTGYPNIYNKMEYLYGEMKKLRPDYPPANRA